MRAFRLTPPPVAATAVLRPRLLSELTARFTTPIVTLVAPAGYGKTTLLAQAIAENALAPLGVDLWLRCEPADNDANHLAGGLAAALGLATPRRDPRGAITDSLWARSPAAVALILDDVHEVDAGSPGAQLLDSIAEDLPANAHLVLAGRRAPAVRLARRTAAGEVTAVGADDLLLDDGERAAVAAAHGLDATVLDATGGWTAVAALVAAVGRETAEQYVWEEVLAGLPEPTRDELTALVALGGGDDAVIGAALDRRTDLRRSMAGVPLVTHDADGWHEPHPLWRPVLAERVETALAPGYRGRAAAVLHAHARLAPAASLLLDEPDLADDDWALLARIIVDACRINVSLVSQIPLAVWEERLPKQRRDEPESLLLTATITRRRGAALADAHALLQRAWAAARDTGQLDAEASILSQLGHIAWWQDDIATMGAILARAGERAAAGVPLEHSMMALAGAILADIRGDDEGMLAALAGVDDRADRDTIAAAEWFRARALVGLGRAAEAIAHADRAEASADAAFHSARLSTMSTRWYSGDPVDAMRRIDQSTPGPGALPRDQYLASLLFCVGWAHFGELARAREEFAAASQSVDAVEGKRPRVYLGAAEAVLRLAEGDEEAARAMATAAIAQLDELGVEQGLRTLRPLLGAMYLLSEGVRDTLDEAPLGPDRIAARDSARALLDARAGATPKPVPPAGLLLANLPLRCALELAARRVDVDLGRELLDAGGARAREILRDHAAAADAPLARGARDLLRALPTPPRDPVVLRFLGPAEIEHQGKPMGGPDWRRERVRSLLAYLVVQRTTTRQAVMAALWPDLDTAAASQNLRRTLNYVHGVLEPDRQPGDAPWFVRSDADTLRVVADGLVVDVWELDARLDEAAAANTAAPSQALDALDAALRLWRGDFLPECYDDWAGAERDRVRARFITASVRAGELLLGRGDVDRALAIAGRALDAERWAEPAHRLAIAAHLARDDRASARRAYDRCAAALAELGAEPDPQTEMLGRRALGRV